MTFTAFNAIGAIASTFGDAMLPETPPVFNTFTDHKLILVPFLSVFFSFAIFLMKWFRMLLSYLLQTQNWKFDIFTSLQMITFLPLARTPWKNLQKKNMYKGVSPAYSNWPSVDTGYLDQKSSLVSWLSLAIPEWANCDSKPPCCDSNIRMLSGVHSIV